MTLADSKNSTVSNGKAAEDEVKQVIKGNSDLTGSCKPPKKLWALCWVTWSHWKVLSRGVNVCLMLTTLGEHTLMGVE